MSPSTSAVACQKKRSLEELVKNMEDEASKRGIISFFVSGDKNSRESLEKEIVSLQSQFIDSVTKMIAAMWSLSAVTGAANAKANVLSIAQEIVKAWKETVTVMKNTIELLDKFMNINNYVVNLEAVEILTLKDDHGVIHKEFTYFFRFSGQDPQSFLTREVIEKVVSQHWKQMKFAVEAAEKALLQMKQLKSTIEAATPRLRLLMFPPSFTSSFTDM
jgi:hypothetical protein